MALGDAGWQWLGVAGVAGNPKVTEEILRYGGDVLENIPREILECSGAFPKYIYIVKKDSRLVEKRLQ